SPDVAYGADGTIYVSFTSLAPVEGRGTVPDAAWLAVSRDGGRSFGPPVQGAGSLAFHLRVAADPATPGRLYPAWLQAAATSPWGLDGTANPVLVRRSDDGGRTWSAPATASGRARRRPAAPALAVGPGGTVVVAYLDLGDDRLDYEGDHQGE